MAQNNINPVISGLTQAFGIANQIKRMALEEEEAARRERETILREKQQELDQEQQERDFALRAPQIGLRPADGLAKADAAVDMIPDPENPSKLIPNPRKGRIVKSPGGNEYIVPSDQESFNRELQRTAQVEGVKADEFIRRYTAQQQAQLEREKAVEAARVKGRKEVEDVKQGAANTRSDNQIKAADKRASEANASRERAAKTRASTADDVLSRASVETRKAEIDKQMFEIEDTQFKLETAKGDIQQILQQGFEEGVQDGETVQIPLTPAKRLRLQRDLQRYEEQAKRLGGRRSILSRKARDIKGENPGPKGTDDVDESVLDDILKEVQSK